LNIVSLADDDGIPQFSGITDFDSPPLGTPLFLSPHFFFS